MRTHTRNTALTLQEKLRLQEERKNQSMDEFVKQFEWLHNTKHATSSLLTMNMDVVAYFAVCPLVYWLVVVNEHQITIDA